MVKGSNLGVGDRRAAEVQSCDTGASYAVVELIEGTWA